MTPAQLWKEFIIKNPAYKTRTYDVFTFGDKPEELLRLVLCGEKTATSCIYRGQSDQVGDISIILDAVGNAQAIIENTKVSIVPFHEVKAEFAHKEGEGNKTLSAWRKIHQAFWKEITPETLLECEEFKLLYHNLNLDIHETGLSDLKNVQTLWANGNVMYFVGFPKGLHKTMAQLRDWLTKLPARNAKHYSIYEKYLGYCGETAYRLENDMAIMDIKLLPIAQGRGIGERALKFSLEQAFQAGAKYAQVTPFEINDKSIHLYKKLGFRKNRRIQPTANNLVLPCDHVLEMLLKKQDFFE